jgi:hypothetical protein
MFMDRSLGLDRIRRSPKSDITIWPDPDAAVTHLRKIGGGCAFCTDCAVEFPDAAATIPPIRELKQAPA